jgi:hypothetical protein
MNGTRSWNWRIWIGFLLTLAAVASYPLFFFKFPVTRDVPWVTFLLFAVALILLLAGLRRAFRQPTLHRGKIAGPILAVLSVAVMALFSYGTLYGSRVPASKEAPKVGEKAPTSACPALTGKPSRWRNCSPRRWTRRLSLLAACSWFSIGGIGDRSATPSYGVSKNT